MAIPFIRPVEEDQQEFSSQQLQVIMALYSALDRFIRTRANLAPTYLQNHRVALGPSGLALLNQELAGLPLPDLVSSAMRQLQQPPSPQVTVSAPTSPTRDATFQFPECSTSGNAVAVAAAAASYANATRSTNYENEEEGGGAPVPTPRPRPRRNRPINVRAPFKKAAPICNGENNYSEYPGHVLRNEQFLIDIGTTLRKIAQDLQASKSKNNEIENPRLSLMGSGFSSNTTNNNSNSEEIVGSLLPASFRETTLWVTVVLYLGWTLISRLR